MTPNSSEISRTLVLSPTPLTEEARKSALERFGAGAEFADLSSLRRQGLRALPSELRSGRRAKVIVTGTPADLRIFGDLLRLLALLVPARERVVESPARPPEPIPWREAPRILVGLLLATLAGAGALCAGTLEVRFASKVWPLRLPVDWKPERCLYLRPTLMVGSPVGGSVGHVAGIVNALARRGSQVRVLASGDQPLLDPEVRQFRVEPDFVPAYPPELNPHRYRRAFFRAAAAHLQQFHPDVIYQRYGLNDLTGPRLRRRFGTPLVLEFNGSEVWAQRHWGRRLRFERLSARIERANLRAADLVVVVSEEVKSQALAAGVAENRILFYPNCVDVSIFAPTRFDEESRVQVRARLRVPADADLFTFVGTFGRWHGTDILAAGIRSLIDRQADWLRSRRIHFLFVGDGHLAPKVRSLLGERLGAPFVTLAGFRPQVETPGILAASDVLLSPHVPNPDGTPFFGSPTKLFEYMAMGKLIVASDLDQIGRVLRGWTPAEAGVESDEERPAAVFVRPGDVGSLTTGIRQAAEMAEVDRRKLGAIARSYVLRAFTWDRNVQAVLERLKSLAGPTSLERGRTAVEAKA